MVDKNQSEDYLTDRDIGVLSKYAQEEKRELYWGYLAAKGDRYAELALGVVHNNTFSGQIANMSLTSHIPEERRIEFTEKHLDDMGIDLMKRDLIARKLDHDHPDKSITTHGGLHLSVTEVRTYHKQWLEEKVHLSPEAWTMERPIGYMLDKGDTAGAERLWNQAMSNGYEFVLGGTEMVARSLDLDTAAQNYAVAQGSKGDLAPSHLNAWSFDTTISTLKYDSLNNFNNPNHVRGFDFDDQTHHWYKEIPAHGRIELDPNSPEAQSLTADRDFRLSKQNNTERFEPHFLDESNPQAMKTSSAAYHALQQKDPTVGMDGHDRQIQETRQHEQANQMQRERSHGNPNAAFQDKVHRDIEVDTRAELKREAHRGNINQEYPKTQAQKNAEINSWSDNYTRHGHSEHPERRIGANDSAKQAAHQGSHPQHKTTHESHHPHPRSHGHQNHPTHQEHHSHAKSHPQLAVHPETRELMAGRNLSEQQFQNLTASIETQHPTSNNFKYLGAYMLDDNKMEVWYQNSVNKEAMTSHHIDVNQAINTPVQQTTDTFAQNQQLALQQQAQQNRTPGPVMTMNSPNQANV